MLFSRYSIISVALVGLSYQALPDVTVTFFSDDQCVAPAFNMSSSASGNCNTIEREFLSYIVPSVGSCGVTVYNENNPFCGLSSKYVATPGICLPRNGTSQFSIDCASDSTSTTTATSSTGTPTTTSSSTSLTTTIPTSTSANPNETSMPAWQIAVTVVFPILGLLLTCIGTVIAYKSYRRGGKMKNIVKRSGTVLSRSSTHRTPNRPGGTDVQMSTV